MCSFILKCRRFLFFVRCIFGSRALPQDTPPSTHRCWKPSPETAPDPSARPPCSVQIASQSINHARELQIEPYSFIIILKCCRSQSLIPVHGRET